MLYKDKEVFIKPYYEKEIEVYKVFYTGSGRDEDGIYETFNEVQDFPTKEKAEEFRELLEKNNLSCTYGYSYSNICLDGPVKKTQRVYLNKEDKIQCMIQSLTEMGYKITKEE